MPDCKRLELPFLGVKSSTNNEIKVFINQYSISIDQKYQNLKLVEYSNEKHLAFCDDNGNLFWQTQNYDNNLLKIMSINMPLDFRTYHHIKQHTTYIKVPSNMKHYTLGTQFKVGTYGGKVIIFHNDTPIGELSSTSVHCKAINRDSFIHIHNSELSKDNIAHQGQVYFVLDKDKNIALKTYKVGDKNVYIKSDYIGGKEYINRIWQEYEPSGTNSMTGSTTKSDAIQCPKESTTAKASTTATSSPTESASTTPAVTATSITTELTTSSTKQLDSVLSTSEASTEMEVMPDSNTMSPENSGISNNTPTIEVTNANKTDSADIQNNCYTIPLTVVAAVVAIAAAVRCFVSRNKKKHSGTQILWINHPTDDSIASKEEEYKSSKLAKNVPLSYKSTVELLHALKGRPLPDIPPAELFNMQKYTPQSSNKEANIAQKSLDLASHSSDRHDLSTQHDSIQNNKTLVELNEALALLNSQLQEVLTENTGNQVGDEVHIYDTVHP